MYVRRSVQVQFFRREFVENAIGAEKIFVQIKRQWFEIFDSVDVQKECDFPPHSLNFVFAQAADVESQRQSMTSDEKKTNGLGNTDVANIAQIQDHRFFSFVEKQSLAPDVFCDGCDVLISVQNYVLPIAEYVQSTNYATKKENWHQASAVNKESQNFNS